MEEAAEEAVEEEAAEEAVEEEAEEEEARQQEARQLQEEEEMQNSSEQSHLPSVGTDKTSIGPFRSARVHVLEQKQCQHRLVHC